MTSALLALLNTSRGQCAPCAAGSRAGLTAAASSPTATWSGVVGIEGQLTGDGRLIEPNALTWDTLPEPFRHADEDIGGHDGAVVAGQILTLQRESNGHIRATGTFDLGSQEGLRAYRQVKEGLTTGVSLDLDDVAFEVRVAAEVLDKIFGEVSQDDPILKVIMGEATAAELADADGKVTVETVKPDDEVRVTTSARIRAATLVSLPAFEGARIQIDSGPELVVNEDGTLAVAPGQEDEAPATEPADEAPAEESMGGMMPDGETPCSCQEGDQDFDPECVCAEDEGTSSEDDEMPMMAAGAAPLAPPQVWFADPHLTGPTALTVTEEGRVYGHLAAWGTCHISHTHSGCVTPPRSLAGYAYFHTGAVRTSEGTEVAVGHLTLNTRHAGTSLSATAAASHYEQTGAVIADVTAGEDSHGIWVAGALRPNASPEQVRELRAAPISGDWRRIAGNLELVAALAVNVPGFPVPRPQGLVASGSVLSLVAAGLVAPKKVRRPGTPGALTPDDLRYLKRLAERERSAEREELVASAAPLVARVRKAQAAELARRVHAAV